MKLSTLIYPKWEVRGLEIFCAVGGLPSIQNKILASGPPEKGAQKRIISISKNFSETSRQIHEIFSVLGGHPYDTLCKIWREFDEGGLGEGVKFDASE